MIVYFYGPHNHKMFRWWRSVDSPDVFDVIDRETLNVNIEAAKSLGFKVIAHLPTFCNVKNCEDCKSFKMSEA